jgi:hypothetical protein
MTVSRLLSAALVLLAAAVCLFATPMDALAHGVTAGDKGYIQEVSGMLVIPFAYLGAKHMVTGYDHLLFLLGVIFFLYRLKDIGIYVSLFALGHSTTMILGVLADVSVSAYLIDAIIGLSVVYKGLDNIGAFRRWLGFQPDTRAATLIFGFFHGFGLATKILDYEMSRWNVPQPAGVQRGRRDRSAARAQRDPHCHDVLATHPLVPAACLHWQCDSHDRRLRTDGLSARRLLPLRRVRHSS